SLAQEFFPVAGFAQRLCGHGAHLLFLETMQPFGEARQAFPAAFHGGLAEYLAFVESAALAHGFLEVLDALNVPRVVAPDFQAETVGAKVNGGEKCSVLHAGGGWSSRKW